MTELEGLKTLEEKIALLLDRYTELQEGRGNFHESLGEKDREIERLVRELDEARRTNESVRARVAALVERISEFGLDA